LQRGFFFLNWQRSADIEHACFDKNKKKGQFMQARLSPIDRKILRLLQHDADLSAAEIAERVELSQSPCWRRIHRLQEEGLIERTVALLNARKLGLGMTVFVEVKLSGHGRLYLTEFENAIIGHPEVMECYTMAGGMDFMLKVVAQDIAGYERFLRDHLLQLPHVQEAHSNIAMSTVKHTTELPLD
jgi:Lrp/AsnC family transcriptional regulator